MATIQNFVTRDYQTIRGDTFEGGTINVSQSGYDFTGSTCRYALVTDYDETPATSGTLNVTIPGAGEAEVNFRIPAVTMADLIGTYYYDLEFTLPDGRVRTVVRGTITVIKDATV